MRRNQRREKTRHEKRETPPTPAVFDCFFLSFRFLETSAIDYTKTGSGHTPQGKITTQNKGRCCIQRYSGWARCWELAGGEGAGHLWCVILPDKTFS
eukprot:COSAG06_NODE_502_length_14953_cov_15.585297_12_plen_97_part_00